MSGRNFSKPGTLDMGGMTGFLTTAFPAATANHVSAVSGVPAATVDKWLRGETRPSATHFAALIAAFGPAFLVAAVPAARPWAKAQVRDDDIARKLDELRALLAA